MGLVVDALTNQKSFVDLHRPLGLEHAIKVITKFIIVAPP